MKFIIAILVAILGLYITGYFMKKRYYKEIDRLESWKMELLDKPFLEEISKVKQLNMTGETEQLFENWRNEWDEIVATTLPDVEEYLFDAEEYIDRYRFHKAKEVQMKIADHLKETETQINQLLNNIKELVGSEEKNRTEIEELKEAYRENRKTLLAHRHTYGKAEKALEGQLDEVSSLFQQFDDQTKNGDYLSAREVVMKIQSLLSSITHKMSVIPNLLITIQSNIPTQLNEVKDGYREMIEQDYLLEHIQFEKEITKIENTLQTFMEKIEKIETEEVEKGIEAIGESIDLLYDLLEKEVMAKHFVLDNGGKIKNQLFDTQDTNNSLKYEIQHVLQTYHLSTKEIEGQHQLEKKLMQLFKRFELLEHRIKHENSAHSILSEEMEAIQAQLEEIDLAQSVFSEKLQTLRKDEIAAREKMKELSRKIADSIRLVSKSNIPGLPKQYKHLLEDAKESIQAVQLRLEEKPLDVPIIQKSLEIAVMNVEKVHDSTNDIIEVVNLVEKVIQYGNRYRSRYPYVDEGLKEAEESFRSFDYNEALEQAATTIEKVEPGAMKKIELLFSNNENVIE